ncbi:hypothetical protein BCR42DRAFT_421102 [Absidia repens]|uniref:F-box domain-containing protein n=1 Tax=Absidia repens TaxID=90262 RepID=A0A1X2I7Z2_9FUNG|nr:hypothetical protein BCR42DRAFT_421102 [Absidia repens]
MTVLGILPIEVITLIVRDVSRRDLYQCALVNQSFHTATTPFLWQTLRIHDATTLLRCFSVHTRLAMVATHVRTIDLQHCHMTNDQLLSIVACIPQLKRLFLSSGTSINDSSFRLIPSHCPQLESLSLAGGSITRHSLEALGQHCHGLRHLHLRSCLISTSATMAFSSSVPAALAQCTKLEKLALGDFDSGGWLALEEVMAADVSCFVALTHVALWRGSANFIHRLLTTAQWPRLTHVRLDHVHGLRHHHMNQLLARFLQTHPHITWLELSNSQLTDEVLETIMEALPTLVYLDVSHNRAITQAGVRRFLLQCPLLTTFDLTSCDVPLATFPELMAINITTLCTRRTSSANRRPMLYLTKLNKTAIKTIRRDDDDVCQHDNDDDAKDSDIRWWVTD